MVSNVPNAMFLNGPKAGDVIYLQDPPPERVTVCTMINLCHHRPEMANPMLNIEYKVCPTGSQGGPLYSLVTEDKTIGNAYYCMECKANSEAKYGLRELRDKIDELLNEDEEDEQW